MAKEELLQAVADLGLTMSVEFVPFSRSRNAKPNAPIHEHSLNWKVTILRDGRAILTTDYGAGIAHCPSYPTRIKQGYTVDESDALHRECESGKSQKAGERGRPILPELIGVLYSLASDSDVIDHPTFESWAGDLGYDTDSRKAEATYRACLEIALALRAGLGEAGLTQLREAARDY